MKRLYLLFILAISLYVFSSCSLLPGKEDAPKEDTQPVQKNSAELSAEIESNNKEFMLKLGSIEKQYIAKRDEAKKQFADQSKAQIDKAEQERLSRDNAENSVFQEKYQYLYNTGLNSISQNLSTELKRVTQEYDTEMARIGKEYDATIAKIDAEYNIKIQEISSKYMDSSSGSDQETSEMSKADQAKLSQEASAEKKRVSQEYTASLKRAEQEKTAQNNSDKNKAVIEKKYLDLSQLIEKIKKSYEDSILSVKASRDNVTSSFVKENTKKYDDSFSRLVSEKTIDTTKWEILISQEIGELSNYYAEQEKKYNDSVTRLQKSRSEEISRLLN